MEAIEVECLYCGGLFETDEVFANGLPRFEYCSNECYLEDSYNDYDDDTYEKFTSRGKPEEW